MSTFLGNYIVPRGEICRYKHFNLDLRKKDAVVEIVYHYRKYVRRFEKFF